MNLFFKLLLIILFYALSLISGKSTEIPPSLVTDLSKKVISINVNFSGSKFHIFGAIKKHHSQISPIDQPPFDILIEVIGPPIAMDLFKKEKRYGIWVNKKIQNLNNIPSFYSISGTKPLEDLLPLRTQQANEIGISEQFSSTNHELKKELIDKILLIGRIKKQYYENNTPITLLENTLFSNELDFPTDLYEGNYKVKIYLIRFEEVLATKEDIIYVKKIGIQNWINYLAYKEPRLYGIASILIAVSFGFGASLVFRKKV
tara:strand:- start:1305 stop:2084 length:780 start_codon:yes stop_codon:yes gene_type:complete